MERRPGSFESAADGFLCGVQHLGDLFGAEPEDVAQHQDHALFGGKELEGGDEGERDRFSLFKASVGPILFLDEPTTGLDPSGRAELWAVIQELAADGVTVLLTTQYLEEADRLSDSIIVIDEGRILAQGTPQELKATLGTTILAIRLADAQTAREATAALDDLGIRSVLEASDTVAVRLSDKGPQILAAVRALDARRITPVSLNVRQPTLDDVFLQLTSRRPHRGGAEDTPPPSETGVPNDPGRT